jgi:hypothetical protein
MVKSHHKEYLSFVDLNRESLFVYYESIKRVNERPNLI